MEPIELAAVLTARLYAPGEIVVLDPDETRLRPRTAERCDTVER